MEIFLTLPRETVRGGSVFLSCRARFARTSLSLVIQLNFIIDCERVSRLYPQELCVVCHLQQVDLMVIALMNEVINVQELRTT